jgi:hypothetical protein
MKRLILVAALCLTGCGMSIQDVKDLIPLASVVSQQQCYKLKVKEKIEKCIADVKQGEKLIQVGVETADQLSK